MKTDGERTGEETGARDKDSGRKGRKEWYRKRVKRQVGKGKKKNRKKDSVRVCVCVREKRERDEAKRGRVEGRVEEGRKNATGVQARERKIERGREREKRVGGWVGREGNSRIVPALRPGF